MMELYHGTSIENAESILRNGFSIDFTGKNWGTTLGDGIYFTPNKENVATYGNVVLRCICDINPFLLTRDYSPTSKNDKRKIKSLIDNYIKNGINDSFKSFDGNEYVVFIPEKIKIIGTF